MKAYTDLEQSKTLAEILPTESADMYYHPYPNDEDWYDIPNFGEADLKFNQLPCWSLSALLDVIPVKSNGYKDMVIRLRMDKGDAGPDEYNLWYEDISTGVATSLDVEADSFVDACVAMIEKLHEQKLL